MDIDLFELLLVRPLIAKIGPHTATDHPSEQRAWAGPGTSGGTIGEACPHTDQQAACIATDKARFSGFCSGLVALRPQLKHTMARAGEVIGHQRNACGTDDAHGPTRRRRTAARGVRVQHSTALHQRSSCFSRQWRTHERRRHFIRKNGAQSYFHRFRQRQSSRVVRLRNGSAERLPARCGIARDRLYARLLDRVERRRDVAFRPGHAGPARFLRGHLGDLRDLRRVSLAVAVQVAEELPDLPVCLIPSHPLRSVSNQIAVDQPRFQRISENVDPDRHPLRSGTVAA